MRRAKDWRNPLALFAASLTSLSLLAADGQGSDAARSAAKWSAVADSVTTYAGHTAGGMEGNPLLNASPAGLLGLIAVKLGLISYVDTLPERQRLSAQRDMASIWSGMSANNLAIAAGAASTLAIPIGLLTGLLVHRSEALQRSEAVTPLPAGLRATDRNAVSRMQVVAVRRAGANGKRSANAPLELAVVANGESVSALQAVYRPDGSKHFVEKRLGEIPVTSEAYAHAVRQKPGGEARTRTATQEAVVSRWRYAYAVQRTRADGSVDAATPEEQIVLDAADRPGPEQKLLRDGSGRLYRIVRQIAAYPVFEIKPYTTVSLNARL